MKRRRNPPPNIFSSGWSPRKDLSPYELLEPALSLVLAHAADFEAEYTRKILQARHTAYIARVKGYLEELLGEGV